MGKTSPRFDFLSEASWCCYWKTLRQVRRTMCHLRFLRSTIYSCPHLRRVELRFLPGTLCDLWRSRDFGRLLLQRVHQARKGQRICPKIVNLGSAKTDLFYERKKFGFKKTF